MVTTANKIKTAAAARPKPNDHQLEGVVSRPPQRRSRDRRSLTQLPYIFESFPYPFEKHRRRLCWSQLSQFVFKLGKIVHCGCKVFFKLVKAYRYRDAAVFCEIPSAPAISLNVRSFQIFKTSTSR